MDGGSEMTVAIKLVVAGAGLVGKQHVESISLCKGVELLAIVDPSEQAKDYAGSIAVPWYHSLSAMFANESPDGVILATPTPLHVENGLQCIAHKCPTLIEKPLATSSNEAAILVDKAKAEGVPILVGHHRRHNPLIKKAHDIIDSGELGQLRAVHANCWLFKPDDYFETAPWRKELGAGPVSVNLAHDIDLLRYLSGNVVSVQAQASRSLRGYENEDVAAAVLRFENDAIGTITVSDVIVSPLSWELTAHENPAYPKTSQSCYHLGGTHGSLSLPDLTLWKNGRSRSWWEPISATSFPTENSRPLLNQIMQFSKVISGSAEPLVTAEDGFKTLQVIESIQCSAKTGETVFL